MWAANPKTAAGRIVVNALIAAVTAVVTVAGAAATAAVIAVAVAAVVVVADRLPGTDPISSQKFSADQQWSAFFIILRLRYACHLAFKNRLPPPDRSVNIPTGPACLA